MKPFIIIDTPQYSLRSGGQGNLKVPTNLTAIKHATPLTLIKNPDCQFDEGIEWQMTEYY